MLLKTQQASSCRRSHAMQLSGSCIELAGPNSRLDVVRTFVRAHRQRQSMAQAELLRAVSLARLLHCGMSALEAQGVLDALTETLRSIPATAPATLVSGALAALASLGCRATSRCRACLFCPFF